MNQILITADDLTKFMDRDNYIEFCEYVKEKGKFYRGFWFIAEDSGELST